MFIDWLESDASVQAFAKIHEYRHEFLHRPYLKADGMPASYSPDFIVRTADKIFIVETKAQSALSDENVQRKQRAAISWVDQINTLDSEDRSEREWPTYYSGSKQ
ncbi:MAG TPA: TnsA endonuclease N-terminal domain-containing protein [Acidimicrobiales bacterium]|nr:TnsA endonuclease N-terminal domain-containing protein [Acidimicrobiales bacterium]